MSKRSRKNKRFKKKKQESLQKLERISLNNRKSTEAVREIVISSIIDQILKKFF